MTRFCQLHVLTSFPPSNLNRDDLGRPKTATVGGSQRLRISSQSLKRAWRTCDYFQNALAEHTGVRTREMGNHIFRSFTTGVKLTDIISQASTEVAFPVMSEEKATEATKQIAGVFGELKKDSSLRTEQLTHFSPDEIRLIENLIITVATEDRQVTPTDLDLLRKDSSAVDIAMFGRMLSSHPQYNVEAAVQVAHAITTHRVLVEDDFFTAVDDLNNENNVILAGHLGEFEFAAGLFYMYICINQDLLEANLGGNKELAAKAIKALTESVLKITPTGKQNSFATRAYASYVLAEKGSQQPRSLSVAFLKGIEGKDLLESSIEELKGTRERIETAYGKCCDSTAEMNVHTGEGSITDLLDFVSN